MLQCNSLGAKWTWKGEFELQFELQFELEFEERERKATVAHRRQFTAHPQSKLAMLDDTSSPRDCPECSKADLWEPIHLFARPSSLDSGQQICRPLDDFVPVFGTVCASGWPLVLGVF